MSRRGRPQGRGRLRIVAGAARGRPLVVPRRGHVRPTPDRVREALFSMLGDRCVGAAVLDLCAGSGALGLEALSRGAASVLLIERDRQVVEVLRENVARVGLPGAQVVAGDARREIARLGEERARFDLVLLDPPFDAGLSAPLVSALVAAGLLAAGGVVVVEHREGAPPEVAGLTLSTRRRYGTVALAIYGGE